MGALPLGAVGCAACRAAQAEGVRAPVAPPAPQTQGKVPPETLAPAPPAPEALVISALGDCTLGTDYRVVKAPGSFHKEMDAVGNDAKYPFSGVLSVLAADDLTIA